MTWLPGQTMKYTSSIVWSIVFIGLYISRHTFDSRMLDLDIISCCKLNRGWTRHYRAILFKESGVNWGVEMIGLRIEFKCSCVHENNTTDGDSSFTTCLKFRLGHFICESSIEEPDRQVIFARRKKAILNKVDQPQ